MTQAPPREAANAAAPPVPADVPGRVLHALAPALVYLAVRQVGLLVLAWMSSANGVSVLDALTSWDGQWFLGLAAGGYGEVPGELTDASGRRLPETPLAFFPGYPAAIAAVALLPGVGEIGAALAVSTVSGVALAYGLMRLAGCLAEGSPEFRYRAGLLLVMLVAAAPMGVAFSMAYSEALFCALAVWALVGLLRGQWLLAGTCCAAAGLVRPTAGPLVAAIGLAAVVAVARRRAGWRVWAGAALAPLGLLGYLGYVAARTGELGGWFALQRRGWDSAFDGGVSTLRFSRDALASAGSVLGVVTVALLAGAVVLLVACAGQWWRTPAWPLLVYAVGVLAMDLGSNGLMNSKARLLLPAFVLLVPVAVGLARRRPVTASVTTAAVVLASAWFGGYALTVWPYAI